MNMKAYSLSDNFIILHLIEYVKMIPLAKLKIGVFWALFFSFYVFVLVMRGVVLQTSWCSVFPVTQSIKIFSIIIIFLYIHLVIDCPKQKGKDVAIVA